VTVLTYRITLEEPTLVTTLDADPNSAVAFNHLPGSVLRGAFIARYLRVKNLSADQFDAADPDVRRLFFDGSTRYLNGHLVDGDQRSLPTPQSWQRGKGEDGPIYDFAVEEPANDKQWQGVSTPFCTLRDKIVRLIEPERHITIHTQRDRRYGRAREESGAVFRHESLASGQRFQAAVICEQDSDAPILLSMLKGEVKLGGSRNSGYGRASFDAAKEWGSVEWRETGGNLIPEANGKLIVTLLSDALIRDAAAHGQFVVDPVAVTAAVAQRLGGAPLRLRCAFLRGQIVGGFNRKWGLPLPQAPVVQMGSVFVYYAPVCTEIQLKALEALGIGERRVEGFGRVAVNWHAMEEELVIVPPASTSEKPALSIPQDSLSRTLAKDMVERMLRRRLDSALARLANDLGKHVRQPPASQLARLRAVIQDALQQPPSEGRERLLDYLESLHERKSTRKQFTHDRVAGKTLLEWLHFRIYDDNDIWQILKTGTADVPKIGDVPAALTTDLAYELNLRLVHEVLARAAKESRKEAN
jgi:CRISPR-associated protein Csx10